MLPNLPVVRAGSRFRTAAGYGVTPAEHTATVALLTEHGSVFTSSLYRDVTAGRPHEGEHLLGHFAAIATQLGLSAPLTHPALMQLRTDDLAVAR